MISVLTTVFVKLAVVSTLAVILHDVMFESFDSIDLFLNDGFFLTNELDTFSFLIDSLVMLGPSKSEAF